MFRDDNYRQPVTLRKLSSLINDYLQYCAVNLSEAKVRDFKSCWLQHLSLVFGNLHPKYITRNLIEQYKAKRKAEYRWNRQECGNVTPRTINKELTHLSAFLSWAADHGHCDTLNFHIKGFAAKHTKPPPQRPLLPQHINALLDSIEPQYRLMIMLMADAGLRATEALQLRRENVDFAAGIMYIKGKGSKDRIVPITTDRLAAELDDRCPQSGYYLINQKTKRPYTSIKKALTRAAKKAGIYQHVHHHLLRHSFGTTMVVAGSDLPSIQAMMGHESIQTTQIYVTMAAEMIKTQGRKLNDLIKNSCPHGESGQDE